MKHFHSIIRVTFLISMIILLFQGTSSRLIAALYSVGTYTLESTTGITPDSGVETATIDIGSQGRMWLASDEADEVFVRHSDSPYSSWSSPIQIASGINTHIGYITVTIPASTIQDRIDGEMANDGWLMVASHATEGQRERTREWTTVEERPGLTVNYLINPPDQPDLVSPADNAVNITTSPSLSVTVTDHEERSMTVNYYGRKKESDGETFTLVGLPDSQSYTAYEFGGTPAMFNAQTQWVKENRLAENIAFVSHSGDVVDTDNETQWNLANTALSILDVGASVPYGIAIGNHDATSGSSALYNTYFGVSRFAGRSYYGGHYGEDNDNNYELFSAGGMDFLVIHLEYDPAIGAIQWADGILRDNPSKRAIVTSHSLIGKGNPASFSSIGQTIYDELRDNPNLFMMLCGHVNGAGRRTDTYNGSIVHTLLADYQSDAGGGNGYLRIMEFSPQTDEIFVKTYSPYLDQWITDSDSQFTLNYEMESDGFQLTGTTTDIESGSEASITWDGLESGTEYEWYVTVSNGNETITGPVWSFTTAPQAVWTGSTGTDWESPTNWTDGFYPGPTNNVTIPDVTNDPVIGTATSVDCHDLEIQPGAGLTIQATPESSGSLIVHGTATGNVTYNRFLRPDDQTGDKHLFSSPVGGQSIPEFRTTYIDKIDYLGTWDEPGAVWAEVTEGVFMKGRGYNVCQKDLSDGEFSFTGPVVNSASVTVTSPYSETYSERIARYPDNPYGVANPEQIIWASGRGWTDGWGSGGLNLLGNPFTSAMNAETFITVNVGNGTTTNRFDPYYQALYVYDGVNGVYKYSAVSAPLLPEGSESHGSVIQAGQGFMVMANNNDVQFEFTSAMQTHATDVVMLKSPGTEDPWPGLQLRVRYGEKESATTIVYNDEMTAGLDPGYDVGQLSAGPDVEIYTVMTEKDEGVNLARQALPISGAETLPVPVGIDTEKGGEVTFSAFTVQLGNNKFWLEDRETGIFTDLNNNTYTVTLPANTYGTGRFFIIASVSTPTGINQSQAEETGVRIWISDEKVIIRGEVSDRAICEVYDLRGKKILETILVDGELNTVALPSGSHGVYLVRVVDGVKVTTRKVTIL